MSIVGILLLVACCLLAGIVWKVAANAGLSVEVCFGSAAFTLILLVGAVFGTRGWWW